jgi:hypothetical protein
VDCAIRAAGARRRVQAQVVTGNLPITPFYWIHRSVLPKGWLGAYTSLTTQAFRGTVVRKDLVSIPLTRSAIYIEYLRTPSQGAK